VTDGYHFFMSGRARPGVLAFGLLLLVSSPAVPARAAADTRATATQDGWWNRLQGPADGEPDGNPIRPLVPAVPKPPNVPADAIATGTTGGQVDKVAGVGIDVALADGATLDGLTLRLKESTASGANVGADKAKVVACPATNPWGSGQNAAWRDRPVADCGLGKADGVRAADGTWTFDLAALGRLWADRQAPLAANGVVLSVDPAVSPSAQVSWVNVESGGVGVELSVTAPGAAAPADAGPAAPEPVGAPAPLPTPDAGPGPATAEYPVVRGGIAPDPLAYPSGQSTFAAAPPASSDTAAPSAPAETDLVAAPAPSRPALQARRAVDFWERVPAPTALLVPVAIGLAVLVGVALGPVGRPSPVFRREGGLSRALARRSPGGSEV
jgi:hypothetical protein